VFPLPFLFLREAEESDVMTGILAKYRVPLLFIFGTVLYFCANIQRVAIPGAVFDELQMKWSLSASQVTAFGACFMYIYAVFQLFVGLFCDRYGGARVIAAGGLIFVLGGFLFSLADNYYLLCFGRLLTGLGASAFYLGLVAESIRFFKKNYSIIISVIVMTGYAGGIVANAPFSFAVRLSDLRMVLAGVAVFTLVAYLLYLAAFREVRKPPVRHDVLFSPGKFLAIMKSRQNWYVFCFSAFNWGLYYSLQTVIGKKFLEDYCRIPTGTAAVALSVTSVISSVAGFAYAVGSRKIGDRRRPFCLLTGFMTFSVFLLLVVLTALDIRNGMPALLFFCLASTASLSSIVIPIIKENNDSQTTGSAIAFSNFLAYILVAIFGNLIGGVLNLFAPEHAGHRLVYSREAYLAVFGVMLFFAAAVLRWALLIREPGTGREPLSGPQDPPEEDGTPRKVR